jgi:methionine--tRNA ligase beta chain
METINIDDFLKIKIKIGKILEAEHLEQSNKLLKLKVDFGNDDIRTVLSGISKWYDPEELINNNFAFVINLAPRKILDYESQAMILAAYDEEKDMVSILKPDKQIDHGINVN